MEQILKEALKKHGMTQKELSEKIFVTPQAVSKWMRGESRPTLDNVIKIDEVLGINIVKSVVKKECRGNQTMKHLDLNEINNYDLAEKEAIAILSEAQIETNYSHSVYMLCRWLVTAVIGLTYHQMVNHWADNEDDEFGYNDIFTNLEDYFEDPSFDKRKGIYENYLEYSFYRMGGDLFESFDEYKIINHDYCRDSMSEWYQFNKSIIKSPASSVYNEFLVALAEIISID